MTRDEAISVIRDSELSEYADAIIEKLEPSIQIDAVRVQSAELPIGASRFGGEADLPDGFSWPTWMGSQIQWDATTQKTYSTKPQERQLDFLAQIDLRALQQFSSWTGLPDGGSLYFFYDFGIQPWGYDPSHRGASRVVYVEGDAPRRRCRGPSSGEGFKTFPCAVSPFLEWTIPNWEGIGLDVDNPDGWDIVQELQNAIGVNRSAEYRNRGLHRIRGCPDQIQGDMRLECQLVSHGINCGDSSGFRDRRAATLAPGAEDWLLLLQIDSDESNPGWMWGDSGRIYYWIHRNDLRLRQFGNARLILQCY